MTNALVTSSVNNREQLVIQQQQLAEQLKQLQFQLYDKSSADVVAHINQLQLEKAKQQGILQQAQQQLAQLNPELDSFNTGAEQILLEAISQQSWYSFKNKREIVFDSRTGDLYPNFEYVPHIKYKDWKAVQKEYAPNGVGKKLWQLLYDTCSLFYGFENDSAAFNFDYPASYRGKTPVNLCEYYSDGGSYANNRNYHIYFLESFSQGNSIVLNRTDNRDVIHNCNVLPVFKILDNPYLLPDYPRLTAHEKAKIILDFFVAQNWTPDFEPFLTKNKGEDKSDFQERLVKAQAQCNEYNRIFSAYYQRIQLQTHLIGLEQQIAQLPEPEPENLFTSDFNYRQEIQHYNLSGINSSVWQYSLAAQQWLNYLLTQIDDWANRHQHLLAHALELNNTLAKKRPTSIHLTNTEQQFLTTRHQQLQQALNFGLETLRIALIEVLQQAQHLEQQLKQTTSLTVLADLEQQARPTFSLLAEHSATLCTQTLKKLEWLEKSLDFVQEVVKSEQQTTESYLIFLDKSQQDLLQQGTDNSVEAEHSAAWFSEWRQERLQMLQQWQPLVQAGLQGVITEQTVLDTIVCMQNYQQQLDQFYIQKRLGIHTTYAFLPNGHRQEKLEKEQELTKLNHQFMQQLEVVIFSAINTAQKIWLVRFSEVWQQGIVQKLIDFLEKEHVIDRSDIVQIMNEEMRKLQQQSLASVLQDAKNYSQALAQREKDTSTLMFKMRKALKA
jgi:hypothetical protein